MKFQINLQCLGYINEIIDNTIERIVNTRVFQGNFSGAGKHQGEEEN